MVQIQKKSNFLSSVRKYFSWLQIILILAISFVVSSYYLYLTTKQKELSIVLGFISMFFIFYFIAYIPKKIKREQFLLKELQKYASNLTYYFKSGYNVPESITRSIRNLDPEVQKDAKKTLDILYQKVEFNTEHFKKYKFRPIDIFHETMKIKFENGGNAEKLFSPVHKDINFEIVKRDELFRKKNQVKNMLNLMVGMVLFMPFFLTTTADVYDIFLSLGTISVITVVALYFTCLIFLCRIHYKLADLRLLE